MKKSAIARNPWPRIVRTRPRLLIATALAVAVGALLPSRLAAHAATRALLAWNAGTLLYIVLAVVMMIRSDPHKMRRRAQLQDEGQPVLLILTTLAAVASLAAMASELAVARDLHGLLRVAHVALAGITVLSSWAFIQIMFAFHYAHDYYAAICRGAPPGLRFPDDPHPDYGDFFYFSAIIGTSGQTADVAFVTKPMRRIGSLHCILAYLFNTTVIALVINITASLF